jgi:hypothetical protein
MTYRSYVAQSVGLRLLMVLGVTWWLVVGILAIATWNQPVTDTTSADQLLELLLRGRQ